MPYHIGAKGTSGCSGFPVVKTSDGKVMGCHATKEKAKKQLAALYINEPSASKSEEKLMATTDFATSYAAIIKQEKQDDGTLLVYGKATDDALDIDNQICDAAWLNKAMPEWFKSGGNIREQHSSIAAGVAKELDSKEDGHYISALVVDASSVKKVEAGVLKGFSIGIRSPRIVRDQKAANGRIIDGTIVEVSLVDRPANPNAKLMLAKSIGTEVVQVEEMIEEAVEAVVETIVEAVVEEAPVEVAPEATAELVDAELPDVENKSVDALEIAKTIAGDIVKFDQALYAAARTALAQLIIVEAKEMEAGHDERYSLNTLLSAINCLEAWYEGEEAEGEVAPDSEMEMMEMSAKAEKCLECGCNVPNDSHGRSNVTTAEMISPDGTAKSPTTTLPRFDIDGNDITDNGNEEENSVQTDKSALSDDAISAIIEKAVKSATETVRSEIDTLKSAREADTEVINKLESELATANSKAANGGPKRAALKPLMAGVNDFINKAAEYRAKAASTSDPILAKGWKEMAQDFELRATQLNETN